MAEVYSAQDNVLGRVVAVKVMLPQYAEDADFARRFRQEAAAAANLQSPYIVNVYDWGHDGDTYFIVMEYVRGSDLKTAIEQRGAINQRKVAEIGAQVCQALSVAHQQDIIHRDVKPHNIMVQPDGNVKVMDFGIARAKNSTADKTQTVLGTAHYISPEQAQGKELTAASDIYSLGVVLYEAATGQLPFDGPDAVSVALMQVRDLPVAPREINPNIDPALEDIILRALEKDPHRRFATVNDMRHALNDFLAGRASARNDFNSAATNVLTPIGAAGTSGVGKTSVMPVTPGTAPAAGGQTSAYISPDPEKKSGKKGAVVAVCVLVALALIAALVFFFTGSSTTTAPNVVGMKLEQAQKKIESAGFEVGTITTSYDEGVAEGLVISQDPTEGTQLEKGASINIVVSQGTEKITVPDVRGYSTSDAENTLKAAGFEVGKVTEENSDSVESGKIISQSLEPNSSSVKGAVCNLVVSKGAETQTVPNLVGMSLEQAKTQAEAAGFTLSKGGEDYSSSVNEGEIISQNPTSGSKAAKGSAITYTISLGEKTSSVPNVVGYTESGATNALQSAGYKVKVTYKSSSSVSEGNVISQTPDSGTSAAANSTVTITVSTGKETSSTTGGDTSDESTTATQSSSNSTKTAQ
jgi:serine/threonine-protein kinase